MKKLMAAVIAAAVLSFGCGRKGPPRPPEEFAPAALGAFEVEGTVSGVVLRWAAPSSTAAGDPLDDLAGFSVMRSVYERGEAPDFVELEFVEAPGTEAAPAAAGGEQPQVEVFQYVDQQVEPGRIYDYMVVPVNERGYEGEFPGRVRVTFIGTSSVIEVQP